MTNLAGILNQVNGTTFVSIDTLTKPTLKGGKSNPMQGRITKRMLGASVMVFQNKNSNGYENMVKRRLAAEGKDPETFTLGARAWGNRLENVPVVEHMGNYYLEVIFLKPGKVDYFLDGNPIASTEIQGLDLNKENADSQGGLENKVVVRTFAFASLLELRINKQVFNGPFTYDESAPTTVSAFTEDEAEAEVTTDEKVEKEPKVYTFTEAEYFAVMDFAYAKGVKDTEQRIAIELLAGMFDAMLVK